MTGRSKNGEVAGLQPTTRRRARITAQVGRRFGRSAVIAMGITVAMMGFAGQASAARTLPPQGAGFTSVGCDPVLHQLYVGVSIYAQGDYAQNVAVDTWIWSNKSGWFEIGYGWQYGQAYPSAHFFGFWTQVPAGQYIVWSNYAWWANGGWQTRAETIGSTPPAPGSITYYSQYDNSRYSHYSTTCFA